MTSHSSSISPLTYARIAGILYLLLMPLGIFGILYVPSTLIVADNVALTINNIIASEGLFRSSIVSALLVQIINMFVVLFLYKLLKPVNKNYAVLMVIFLFMGVPIAMFNELNQLAVLQLLSGANYLTAFSVAQVQAQVMLFLDLHGQGVFIAQIFWGLWLFPMGYLIFKSGFLPKALGILLMIGCFGYVIDSAIFFLLPEIDITLSEFTFVGELLLPLWLIIKGVDVTKWEQLSQASS